MAKKQTLNWSKDLAPALIVLFSSIAYAMLYGDFAPLTNWHVTAWMAPLRFARFAFVLCIPLCVLPKVYRFVARKMAGSLIRIDKREEQRIDPLQTLVFQTYAGDWHRSCFRHEIDCRLAVDMRAGQWERVAYVRRFFSVWASYNGYTHYYRGFSSSFHVVDV